jgi:hypothetical protein
MEQVGDIAHFFGVLAVVLSHVLQKGAYFGHIRRAAVIVIAVFMIMPVIVAAMPVFMIVPVIMAAMFVGMIVSFVQFFHGVASCKKAGCPEISGGGVGRDLGPAVGGPDGGLFYGARPPVTGPPYYTFSIID